MRGYVLLSGLVVSFVMAACSGSTPPDALDEPDAVPAPTPERAFFDLHVMPTLKDTCAKCHANEADQYAAPEFLGLAEDQYYDALSKNTSFVGCDVDNSILLLKGLDPSHVGGPLTAEQRENVKTWLTLEAIARFNGTCGGPPVPPTTSSSSSSSSGGGGSGAGGEGGGGPVGPMTGQQAMEAFGNCMSLTDWVDSGMPQIALQEAEYQNNTVQCYNCHKNPNEGELHLPDPNAANAELEVAASFEQMRHMYASFAIVRWNVNPEDGSYKELVSSYRLRDKGQALLHPTYVLNATNLGYYEDFMARTMTKFLAGPCDPNAPPPEPPPQP